MIHAEDRKNLTKPRKKTEKKSSWSPLHFNRFTHPCRPRFTIKQGYDTYQEEYICAHSVVWGTKQLCGGGYSPAVDSPQGAVAGPKGTGRANGQDYYGVDVDEGCQPETALACGTIECKA